VRETKTVFDNTTLVRGNCRGFLQLPSLLLIFSHIIFQVLCLSLKF